MVNTYVKSRENLEHQYWPDQSGSIRKKYILYWQTVGRIRRVVLSVSQSFNLIYVNITVVN